LPETCAEGKVGNITTFAEPVMPTEKTVSAAEANRQFSRLLQGVRRGKSYIVTSHGQPVARISPLEKSDAKLTAARKALFERLDRQPVQDIGHWTRDELYED
jgi:prevent-host-death family protein